MGVKSSLQGRAPISVSDRFVACGARTGMNALVYEIKEDEHSLLAELQVNIKP